jgi:fatty-acyl-CoA synthase
MNIPLTPLRFLRYAERQYPARTAVVCKEKRYNYKEFADRTRRLAGALHQNGVLIVIVCWRPITGFSKPAPSCSH